MLGKCGMRSIITLNYLLINICYANCSIISMSVDVFIDDTSEYVIWCNKVEKSH